MGGAWKTVFSTVLLILFYVAYLVDFGGLKLTGFSLSSLAGLSNSSLLALLSLSFALIALYLPRAVKSPAAVVAPLLASGAIDFYLSLGVPFEFFFLLYAVVPFIGSGNAGLAGVGIFVAFVYALAAASQKDLQLWIPFLLLLPLGAVFAAAKEELKDNRKTSIASLTALTVLVLLPFPLLGLTVGTPVGLLPYIIAMTLLLAGMIPRIRGRDVSWPFTASGLIAYFTPIAIYFLPGLKAADQNAFTGSYALFFLGSFALLFYILYLLSDQDDESYLTLAVTPLLLGITVAIVSYFKLTYYFASFGPWLVAAVAVPKSPFLSGSYIIARPHNYYYAPQQPVQTQQPAYVRFVVTGLPPNVRAVVTLGSTQCDGNAVIDCYGFGAWRAHPVQVGNVIYYPSPDSGYATLGDVINIDYAPVYVGQQTAQPPQTLLTNLQVRFVLHGLPPMTRAVVRIGQSRCDGDSVIDCNDYGRWVAEPVQVGNYVYYPNPDSGYASPGDTVAIYYALAPQQAQQSPQTFTYAPSRPLSRANPTQFDPYSLVNKRLGVYEITSLIGKGGFGYVYLGDMSGKKFAIKVLKLEKGDPVAYFRDLFHEANNLVDLSNHPNIVKVYAVNVDLNVIEEALKGDFRFYYNDPPRIVMEFMEGGSMDKYLSEDTFFYSTSWETAVRKAVRQVADALVHVHGKGYVHLDVKPQNVFLTRKPRDPSDLLSVDFKLGDLGSAVRAGKDVMQVTPEYSPPEVLTSKASPSMDVFALGITLYVLLTRKNDRPDLQVMNEAFDCYVNNDTNCVRQKVEEAKRLLASWDPQVPEPYKSLVKAMTNPDPAKRPTALDVGRRLA